MYTLNHTRYVLTKTSPQAWDDTVEMDGILRKFSGSCRARESGRRDGSKLRVLSFNPSPCTPHPAPRTPHPTPCTLHPTPYSLRPTPHILHPTTTHSALPHPAPNILNPTPHPTPHKVTASIKHQKRTSSTAVPDCPVFHPTAEEFADPFAYIKSISAVGAEAGIAKIVPPQGARRERARERTRAPRASASICKLQICALRATEAQKKTHENSVMGCTLGP